MPSISPSRTSENPIMAPTSSPRKSFVLVFITFSLVAVLSADAAAALDPTGALKKAQSNPLDLPALRAAVAAEIWGMGNAPGAVGLLLGGRYQAVWGDWPANDESPDED